MRTASGYGTKSRHPREKSAHSRLFPILLVFALAAASAIPAQEQAGDSVLRAGTWSGELAVSGISLPLVFNISAKPGAEGSTMDSPKQGAKGIPVNSVTVKGGEVRIEVAALGGYFEGKFAGDRSALVGNWNQGAASFPMTLSYGQVVFSFDRPQEAFGPATYRSEEVRISGGDPGVILAGTFVIPAGTGPFPALVMVTGSGPQNRDEEILGHRPFLVIADYLARRGIASLRYDDRGFGASTGVFSSATSFGLARDAAAACEWLALRPEADTRRLGLLGHSEGGLIAPIVATSLPELDFLVLLAGPGVPGARIVEAQSQLIARAAGQPESAIAESVALNRKIFEAATRPLPMAELKASVMAIYLEGIESSLTLSQTEKEAMKRDADSMVSQLISPWFRVFLLLDPADYLSRLDIPVLALNGSKDLQVPGRENLDALRSAMPASARAGSEFVLLEGLNHLFQHTKTGSPQEYGELTETFAPEALVLIADWITKLPPR